MREHSFVVHTSAAAIVREFFSDPTGIRRQSDAYGKSQDHLLRRVRRTKKWAFVNVPDDGSPATVHIWIGRGTPAERAAMMISHELGHIADGGPHSHLSHDEEEDRADEYARATSETVTLLIKLGVISPRNLASV